MSEQNNNKGSQDLPYISSPYNFVPLPDKVFFPDWAGQISHDVPFANGISGQIEFSLVAETPIFVRNGSAAGKDDNGKKETEFSHYLDTAGNKHYFLPATTIKGAVRSVFEILSFGKMRLDRRAMFAVRDLSKDAPYQLFKDQKNIHCGYLKRSGDAYEIEDHGAEIWRISQKELGEMLGTNVFSEHFCADGKKDKLQDKEKTAAFKYGLLEDAGLDKKLIDRKFSDVKVNNGKAIVQIDGNGEKCGNIVLTGSPDRWKSKRFKDKEAGKFYEFVFPNKKSGEYDISSEMFDHYKFIYDRADEAGQKEWNRIKELINNSEYSDNDGYPGAPVFFRLEGGHVKDFGFAMLYKLPYDKTPYDTLRNDDKGEDDAFKPDMADCLFGYINKQPGQSLKGRVYFSNALAKRAVPDETVTVTPGSPKASYYPCYINQIGNNGRVGGAYKTYNDGQIRGWKRYVLKMNAKPEEHNKENENVNTKMTPLKTGAEFTCRATFFNLRPEELGALLSAITFHNTNECRHYIGAGKPFGYGRTRVEGVALLDAEGNELNKDFYLGSFESLMEDKTSGAWRISSTLRELFAMASKQKEVESTDSLFRYMKLTTDGNNDFTEKKKQKLYLRPFTEIKGVAGDVPRSLRSVYEEEKKRKDAAVEAEAKNNVDSLSERLDNVDLSESAPPEAAINDLAQVVSEVAELAKRYPDSSSVKKLQGDAKKCKEEFEKLMEREQSKIDALPQVSEAEVAAKREALDGFKALAAEAEAKLGIPKEGYCAWCDSQISLLPKALSDSITDVITFSQKKRFEGDVKKWVRRKGTISESQARELNASFRRACADPKTAKNFSGYTFSGEMKELLDETVFNIIFNKE